MDRGISALPISKVNKIIKQDKDVKLCSKEAIFLISKTTEYMLGKLANAGATNARMQSRPKLLKYTDLSTVIHTTSSTAFFYLQPVVPTSIALSLALEKKAQIAQELEGGVVDPPRQEGEEEEDYTGSRKGHTPIVIGKPARNTRPKRAASTKKGKKVVVEKEKEKDEAEGDDAEESNDEDYNMDMD